ncbi:TIGR03617 family F420-dependent LLM class oxidoreductase [Lapillicoccus sp.]|uniref:TIGR03617 family F420-dependent LLM class oxidoreductase n=1 Tax=Lapillicoccus sp. TaxID=1909287 RepID=UPI0025F9F850|nr:TIGR03617 family F420-dependent LLM class oxidoreductase [Lapillicoccus sp.]
MSVTTVLVDSTGDPSASPADLAATSRAAEEAGYDGFFVPETQHDPFITLALAARATERVTLLSGIVVAFARSPMTTAISANDVQELSGGRFVLGLGSQVKPHIERRFAMPWSSPAARMQDYVRAVRTIWTAWETGEPLRHEGPFYQHTLMTPMFSPGPNPHGNPPIHLAAVGGLMTETAGRVADGLIAHPLTTPDYLREVTVPALEKGRAESELALPPVVSLPAFVALGESRAQLDAALTGVRKQLAFYGSTPAYRVVLEHHGWHALHERLHAMSRRGEWTSMADEIDDDVVAAFAVVGTPEEAARDLRSRFSGLVDRLSFSMPYAVDPSLTARLARLLQAGSAS